MKKTLTANEFQGRFNGYAGDQQVAEKPSRSPSTCSGRTAGLDIVQDSPFMLRFSKHS
jgi:hypothetical protein